MRASAHPWRSVADDLAVDERRAGACCGDSTVGSRAGASFPRCDAPAGRWRDFVSGVLLFASLVIVVPISLLVYVGVGRAAAGAAVVVALALMLIGWVVGRE